MKKILLLLASVAVLYSCGNGEGNTDPVVPTPEEQASLAVDVTELSFVAEGEAKTIKISTNKDWKVSTTADWLDLSPESGVAGEDLSVNVTASANTTESVRTATVTIKADKLTKTVSISQEKPAQEPAPGPDQPGNATSYQRGTDPVMYASGLADNKFYVLYSKYYETEVWTESAGKLTMSENENIVFSAFVIRKESIFLNHIRSRIGADGKECDSVFLICTEVFDKLIRSLSVIHKDVACMTEGVTGGTADDNRLNTHFRKNFHNFANPCS